MHDCGCAGEEHTPVNTNHNHAICAYALDHMQIPTPTEVDLKQLYHCDARLLGMSVGSIRIKEHVQFFLNVWQLLLFSQIVLTKNPLH